MKRMILIVGGIFILLSSSCYKDNGNYDYKRVNEITALTFMPIPQKTVNEGNGYEYMYRRPSTDTLKVTYTPVVEQDMEKSGDNLGFYWKVSRQNEGGKWKIDTVNAEELTLAYPPNKDTHYKVDFRVTDRNTGVDYWRSLKMDTRFPFVNGWFLLTGPEGDRKLSSIEQPDLKDLAIISEDAYLETVNKRRFQQASHLMYAAWQDFNMDRIASLTVIQPDTVTWLYAYGLSENRPFNMVFPPNINVTFADGAAAEAGSYAVLTDARGKLYYTAAHGFYFPARVETELAGYQIEKVYLSFAGAVTAWDDLHKQFLYYSLNGNSSNWELTGEETVFPGESAAARDAYMQTVTADGVENDWTQVKIWWLGQGITAESDENGATAVGHSEQDGNCLYIFGDGKGSGTSPVSIRKLPIGHPEIDETSAFAVSAAFSEQLFYSVGSKVMLLNTVNGEARELYDAGGKVTKLQFRVASTDNGRVLTENRRLAIAVQAGEGKGELHELFLDEAADVTQMSKFTGFGEICDLVYAYNVRRDRF